MENTISLTMQHKKVLFLISLPRTPEFQECIEDVNECLDELRQLHVDVREHIRVEDLTEANKFDVVIVVAHRDTSTDELVLADGTMSISDFVSSIPTDFNGVIDFSSCYSATAFAAIKERCPQCRAQVALVKTTLLRRLIIYPTLIECLYDNPEIDYGVAYKEVSKAFDNAVDEIDTGTDSLPMTHLGEQMTSVYAPKEVKRDSVFQIIVFFHYDFEREVVKVKAKGRQSNAIVREETDIPVSLNENDEVSITLSIDSTDDKNLKVKDNDYSKIVKIKKELVIEYFTVKVMPDIRCNSFLANIEMAKDKVPFVRFAFDINVAEAENKTPVEVIAEIPQHPQKPGEIIEKYISAFAGGGNIGTKLRPVRSKLFKESTYEQFLSRIVGHSDEEKLTAIRRYIYNGDLFLDTIGTFLQTCETRLTKIGAKDTQDSEITRDLLPLLFGYVSKQQKNTESLGNKLAGIKKRKGVIRYEDAAPIFIPLENMFLVLVQQVTNLDYQIDILSKFQALREEINTLAKETIKDKVGEIYEHPHYNNTDKDLFELFKVSGTKSIFHTRSSGTTAPFLALALSMILGEYKSSDKGGEDWTMNVERYIDFSDNNGSLRTPKDRIQKLVGLLRRQEIRDEIRNYRKTEAGKISIAAYYLLRIRMKVQ